MNDHRDIAVVQKIILRPYRLIDLFLFLRATAIAFMPSWNEICITALWIPVGGRYSFHGRWVPESLPGSDLGSDSILHRFKPDIASADWNVPDWQNLLGMWYMDRGRKLWLSSRFPLCKVLSEKIADGYLSVNNAKDIINKILFDNAQNIYF